MSNENENENKNDFFTEKSLNMPKIREFGGHDWYLTHTHRRNLPHWELSGSTYFITIRVHAEIGKPFSNHYLAKNMISTLCKGHEKSYDLQAFVVMPDHVHVIIKPVFGKKLSEIMKNLKGSTAYQFNKILNRKGNFWPKENFDHLITNNLSLCSNCGLKPTKTSAD